MMFDRLRVRLTLLCAIFTFFVLLGMATVAYAFSVEQLRAQHEEMFKSNLNSICYVLQTQPTIQHSWLLRTEAADKLKICMQSKEYDAMFNIMDPVRGEIAAIARQVALESYRFDSTVAPTSSLTADICIFPLRVGQSQYHAAVSRVPTVSGWMTVTVLKDMGEEQAQERRLLYLYAGAVALATACLFVFAWVFTGRTLHPVAVMRKKQTEFVAAASHELRAPLTNMQVSAERIPKADLETARRMGAVIAKECGRLARLVDDLLRLAGADNRSWMMQLQAVNPDSIVLDAVECYEQVATEHGVRLQVDLPESALPQIECDRQRLVQVLMILLDNAVRYTPRGGVIAVSASYEKGAVRFSVADSGPGIPEEQRQQVFDRFFQGDRSRTDREHFGLGLSIAKEIILLHEGRIGVGKSALGGAEFIVWIAGTDHG